jgi:hypothetical protein
MEQTSASHAAVELSSVTTDPVSDPNPYRAIASPWHTLLVLIVLALLAYRGALRMHDLALAQSARIDIYKRTILFEWLTLALVLAGVWWHGSSLLTVLGKRWSSLREILRDLGIAVLFLVVTISITSILGGHGDGNAAVRRIQPQGNSEMLAWVVLSLTAGICEEAVFRGYLQRQFMAMTGNGPAGIVLSAIAFGAAHLYQGFPRALQIALLGVMCGILAHWCKSVRPGMFAHALQDILGGFVRHG